MRFSSKHIADSVTERINAFADSIEGNKPMPQSRGPSTIALVRQPNGDLAVTKSFENGEDELLTISAAAGEATGPQPPQGLVQISEDGPQPVEQQLSAGVEAGGIVENAARGGDAIDELLRT